MGHHLSTVTQLLPSLFLHSIYTILIMMKFFVLAVLLASSVLAAEIPAKQAVTQVEQGEAQVLGNEQQVIDCNNGCLDSCVNNCAVGDISCSVSVAQCLSPCEANCVKQFGQTLAGQMKAQVDAAPEQVQAQVDAAQAEFDAVKAKVMAKLTGA